MTNIARTASRIGANGTRIEWRQGELDNQGPEWSWQRGTDVEPGWVEDEDMAGRSDAVLLITAPTSDHVEALARRIHHSSTRAAAPFASIPANMLAVEARGINEQCSAALGAAGGGSLLVTAVEEMPLLAQAALFDWLLEVAGARASSATVRLIAGATESLLDRVTLGTFSERLYYRLNVIHLILSSDARPPI